MFLLTRPHGSRYRARPRAFLHLAALEQRTVPAVGVGLSFAGGSNSNFAPPDTDGSIGPNHYVQFINGRFAAYSKTTGALLQTKSDDQFWTDAGIPTGTTVFGLSDTRMYFDPLSDRWFAVEITTRNSANSVLVGRSNSNDPTGVWKAASYVGAAGFADYPTLGVDANAVYIGTNNFSPSSTTITSIPKADLLLATPSVANRTMREQTSFGMGFTLQGVTNWAPSPAHGSIVAVHESNFTQVKRTTMTGTGGPGASFGATVALNVQTTAVPGNARQPDFTRNIDGLDDRIGGMVYQVGDLIYLVHGISVDATGVAISPNAGTTDAVRLTVIRDSTTQVVAEATWFNANFDYIMPSVSANSFGDIVIGYTRSSFNLGSPTTTDGRLGAYALNAKIDPANPGAGITFGSEVQLKAGQVSNYHLFNSSTERWGDFSATGQDPNNPLAFWTTQEYAIGTGTWGTWVAQVFVSPRAGNVTSTAANGTYGAGAVIPITVTFNNPVTVTGSPQLALNSGGTAVYASGSGTATLTFNYTVGSGQSSADLDYTSTIALTLNGGTIKDALSGLDSALTLAAPGTPGSLGANKNIVIDASVPRVANVTSPVANATYFSGAVIPVTVSFGVPVVVTGTPRLALNSGVTVDYTSGSGTSDLTFVYTVGAGQTSPDL